MKVFAVMAIRIATTARTRMLPCAVSSPRINRDRFTCVATTSGTASGLRRHYSSAHAPSVSHGIQIREDCHRPKLLCLYNP